MRQEERSGKSLRKRTRASARHRVCGVLGPGDAPAAYVEIREAYVTMLWDGRSSGRLEHRIYSVFSEAVSWDAQERARLPTGLGSSWLAPEALRLGSFARRRPRMRCHISPLTCRCGFLFIISGSSLWYWLGSGHVVSCHRDLALDGQVQIEVTLAARGGGTVAPFYRVSFRGRPVILTVATGGLHPCLWSGPGKRFDD